MKTLTAASAALGSILVLMGTPEAPDHEARQDFLAYPTPVESFDHVAAAPDPTQVIQETCVRCHNDRRLRGNLSLEGFDATRLAENADIGERMIRKLRAGMMPPPGSRRPGGDTLQVVAATMEEILDEAAARDPNPGRRSFQRLNRAEYERAIRDLLDLRIAAEDWLPADQMSANFDNHADAQMLSPTLLDAYLNAASEIARMAVGDRNAPAIDETYKNSEYVSQHPWDRVEGAPYGTRGGLVVEHVFPADAEYVFQMTFSGGRSGMLEDIDISIDGERVALLPYTRSGVGADGRGSGLYGTEAIFVRAGQRRVAAAFVRRNEGPYEDLIRPHDWSMAGGGSGGTGVTTLPHMRDLVISGPYDVTGISDTPSRRKMFTCRPTSPADEEPCARTILRGLVTEAFRRPATEEDVEGLMPFYREGVAEGGFEIGVRTALEAILSSPFFVLRLEREPDGVQPGTAYELDDLALASRLSFFLWGTHPDAELLDVASRGELTDDDELRRQALRMLDDPKADALGTRFAAQWFRLQDLYKVRPDPNFFPNFDENLADLMHRETELFFNSLVREDKGVLDLFTADYTFVNERLARHYGFGGIAGNQFQRVQYPDETRTGILGHGSVLVLTSMANRTSPVLRGKWVMEVLIGAPPPPPPPNVPDLEETEDAADGVFLTTRQRLEMHRSNPTCNACHRLMDPIGLALDNFDPTGQWRLRENGMQLDTRGDFYDGTPVRTPSELRDVLLTRPIPLVRTFTENLLSYALGRRVEYYDQPRVRRIVRDAEADGYRIRNLILGVIRSDAFRMKLAAPAAVTTAASQAQQPR